MPATAVLAGNPDQARVPRGNGELSGRWVDTPGGLLAEATAATVGRPTAPAPAGGRDPYTATLTPSVLVDFEGGSAMPHLVDAPEGGKRFSDERAALHRGYRDQVFAGLSPAEGRAPVFNVLGGGPAAGKSTFTKTRPDIERGVALINPDEAKAVIPEYQELAAKRDPTAAGFAHEESSYMSKMVNSEALQAGFDVTLDGTGDSSARKMRSKMAAARNRGYEVNGYYVTVPTAEAIRRADARGQKTGRVVPHSVIENTHKAVSRALPEIMDDFDNLELWDTETVPPTLVLAKKKGGPVEVLHQGRWNYFRAKAFEGVPGFTMPDPEASPEAPPASGFDAIATEDAATRYGNALPSQDWDPPAAFDAAHESYTHEGFDRMNNELRAGLTKSKDTKGMLSALRASPGSSADSVVYRGLSLWPGGQLPRVGDVFTDKGFFSTTTKLATAERFVRGDDGWLMQVNIPAGTKSVWGNAGESEVVFAPGLRYKVSRLEGNRLVVDIVGKK